MSQEYNESGLSSVIHRESKTFRRHSLLILEVDKMRDTVECGAILVASLFATYYLSYSNIRLSTKMLHVDRLNLAYALYHCSMQYSSSPYVAASVLSACLDA